MEINNPEELICNICEIGYNLTEHFPYILCKNEHTVCKWCLDQLRKKSSCPYCREPIGRKTRRANKGILMTLVRGNQEEMKRSVLAMESQNKQLNDQKMESVQNLAANVDMNGEIVDNTVPSTNNNRKKCCCQLSCFQIAFYYFLVLEIALSIQMIIMGVPQLSYSESADLGRLPTKVLPWSILAIGLNQFLMVILTSIGVICYSRGNIEKESFRRKSKIWAGVLVVLNGLELAEIALIFFTRNEAWSEFLVTFIPIFLGLFVALKGIKIILLCFAHKKIRS